MAKKKTTRETSAAKKSAKTDTRKKSSSKKSKSKSKPKTQTISKSSSKKSIPNSNKLIHKEAPSHEELHSHVNPHIHHSEVEHGSYHPIVQIKSEPTKPKGLKSKWRLDWIWTKIRFGKFHPFPLVMILMIGIPLAPLILLAIGAPIPFSYVNVPFLKPLFNYIGVYSDKDLFVISTWVFWWPIFIMTIFIFKRLWCGGFCPFGLTTDMGNWVGNKIRKGKTPTPINITKYIFIGFLVFKALGYLHDAINITNSAVLTVEFVVFFLVYAFIIGMIAPRRSFCRLFCFLGALPHLFGRLSIYTLETDRAKCASCTGQWCITGYESPPHGIAKPREPLLNTNGCPMFINVPQLSHKESNRNCIACGNCVKNCPYDAIHYKPKIPGYELYKGIDFNIHETVFVLGLIPLLAMFVAMESNLLGKFGVFFNFPATAHWAISGSFYLIGIAVMVFFYYLLAGIGAIILDVKFKLAVRNFGYILLPFAYLAFVRDIAITYLLKGSFLETRFPDIIIMYPFVDIPLLMIGVFWSAFMAYRVSIVTLEHAEKEFDEKRVKVNTMVQWLGIAALGWYWFSSIFPEYFMLLENEYYIHFIWPFVFGVVLIAAIVALIKYLTREKPAEENPQATEIQ